MDFQRAGSDEQIKLRKEEIINACEILYNTGDYESITLQKIANMISIGRSSIYTYYHIKDEILLDLLKREQLQTSKDFEIEFAKYNKLSKEEYADILTKVLLEHQNYLKLSSILFTTLEKNCSLEKLTEFSIEVQDYFNTIINSLSKFFPNSDKEKIAQFSFHLHSFITGAYPYLHPTQNRILALLTAKPDYKIPNFYDICYNGILLLLGNL